MQNQPWNKDQSQRRSPRGNQNQQSGNRQGGQQNNGNQGHHNNRNRPFRGSGRPSFGGDRNGYRRPSQPQVSPQQQELERSFFSKLAVDPAPRIYLEKGLAEPTVRALDLICPIGKGQRGLIVSPPKSGKTTFLKHMCQAVTIAEPDMKVFCLLIDERPEEVTDFKRTVSAEVRYSSTDQPYENHIRVARELMSEALALADAGKHVMVFIDSLTRLARVHNNATQGHGRTLSGGVDAEGLLIPRKIFGSARNIENAGSLGIIASILVQTGSRMDDVIFQEFKGTGNMELVLSREISERRIFPAINIRESGTRKEEKLFSPEELKASRMLRSALAGMSDIDAAQALAELIKKFPDNKSIVASLQ